MGSLYIIIKDHMTNFFKIVFDFSSTNRLEYLISVWFLSSRTVRTRCKYLEKYMSRDARESCR